MGKRINKCFVCDKNLGNGDSARFRKVDGIPVIFCAKDDRKVFTFLKQFKDELTELEQQAHFIEYPHIPKTVFILTENQYNQFQGLLSTMQDTYL